ncbi:hypothetical protein ACVWWG_006975 [Bradyrhizobium sp. LB7.2]
MASRPISAASAGEAIIGEAMLWSIMASARPGERAVRPVRWTISPTITGTPITVQAVAVATSAGRRKWPESAARSTRMKEMQSRTKIASVT